MAEYPIPPWLHGVSAGEVGSLASAAAGRQLQASEAQARILQEGQRAAAQFAMEQARLEESRQRGALELELANRRLSEQSARQSQELEMQRQYHDQVVGIRQSEMENQKQRVMLAAKTAATKMAAQQSLQQELSAAGDDEEAKRQAILKWGPVIGGMGTEMGAALRAGQSAKAYGPITVEDLGGGARAAYRPGSPGMHIIPPQRSREPTAAQLAALAKEVPMLEMAAKRDPSSLAAKVLQRIRPMLEAAPATGTTPQNVTTKEQYDALAPGTTYRGKGGKLYRKPGATTDTGTTPATESGDTEED